jgi:PAS domain S-box-containing protein
MTEASIPPSLRAVAAELGEARCDERRLRGLFAETNVPMVMVDGERRHVEANGPARLILRLNIDELRGCLVDDLTPRHLRDALDRAWSRLISAGSVSGQYEVAGLDGSRFEVVYHAIADALPGLHLAAFAPAHWPADELAGQVNDSLGDRHRLTPREIEVLTLAARGYSGPEIARRLVVSPSTVKTHFANIYEKLEVRNRAAAVAIAMQRGAID